MNEGNNQVSNGKKPMDKKVLAIIGVVVLVVVVLLVVLLVKPGSNNGGGGGFFGGEETPVEEKITLSGEDIGNGKILVTAASTRKGTYDVNFSATFYDSNKEVLRVFEETIHAVPGEKNAYHLVDISGAITGDYTYELVITKETEKTASNIFSDKVTATSTVQTEHLEVQLKNTSDQMIDSVRVAVIYYNANKPVGYTSQFISGLIGNMTINEVVYIPTDNSGNPIKFDKHEVIITAYNHETTN